MKTDRESVKSALGHLGYLVRGNHFSMRSERTPSSFINQNGTIHDFGSGWHGDFLDFIQENGHAQGFVEAKALAENLFGRRLEELPKPQKQAYSASEQRPISDDFVQKFVFEAAQNKSKYEELLLKTFSGTLNDKKYPVAVQEAIFKIAKKYHIGYSKMADRLIMPIRDLHAKAVTLWKYSPDQKIKVKYTRDRQSPPFNLADLQEYGKNPDQWVFLVEGEKDCLASLANGLRAVTLGGASKKLLPQYLPLFKGLKIAIVYDYDEQGIAGARQRAEELNGIAAQVQIVDWQNKANRDGFSEFLVDKFDMSDYFAWKHNIVFS